MNGKSVSIIIKSNAVRNQKEEPNVEIRLNFDYEDASITDIKKIGSQYILYENGDWHIWGYQTDFPNVDTSAPNQYTPVLAMSDVKDANEYLGYYITKEDILMGWGTNYNDYSSNPDNSILGDGTKQHRDNAVFISDNVKRYETGWTSGLIKYDGTLWLWGQNRFGQIGNGKYGTSNYALSPIKVLSDVRDFSLGTWHSLALKDDGSVWAWGNGKAIGRTSLSSSLVKIISGNAVEITAGSTHNVVLKDNGDVYCFGENDYGQIGNGKTSNYETPYKVMSGVAHIFTSYAGSYALKSNGDLYRWGLIGHYLKHEIHSPSIIATDVKDVYITENNVFILKYDDSIWAMGGNSDGLLSLGYNELNSCSNEFSIVFEDVAKVWPCSSKLFVQKKDGSIWALGTYLGTGDNKTSTTYTPIEFITLIPKPIENIGIPSAIILEVGETGYAPISISPIDATHNDFIWESSNNDVATVENGIILGISEGETIISVSTNDYQKDNVAQCVVNLLPEGAGVNDVLSENNNIVIIYNINGVVIFRGLLDDMPILDSGIYIIKQGLKTIKYFKR